MKRIITLYFLLIFTLTSCEKFLDEKPDDKMTTPETKSDLWALLDNSTIMNSRCPIFDEVSADNYFLTKANFDKLKEEARSAYLWQKNDYNYVNEIARSSEAIYVANLCIEKCDELLRKQKEKELEEIKGSAMFFRSFYWLRDLWTYSLTYNENNADTDLGIVMRLSSDFNKRVSRNNVRTGYRTLIEYTKAATVLLPSYSSHPMRPSKAAGYALLARTYLSMQKYEDALLYADSCLQIKSDLMDFSTINLSSNFPFESFNREVIFHNDVSSYVFFNISPSYAFVDTLLYSTYNEYDLRKKAYFNPVGEFQQFKGSYWSNSQNVLFTGLATDEIYLIKAECLARLDKIEDSANTLWILMKSRWDKNHPLSKYSFQNKQEAILKILEERRKELLFRGIRWSDIKRLNNDGAGITLRRLLNNTEYKLDSKSEKFALPYPRDLIEISGIEQNRGL